MESTPKVVRRSFLLFLSGAVFISPAQKRTFAAQPRGEFRGEIITKWLGGGRKMQLVNPIEYIASDGTSWPVPEGTVVDGASIPSVFWSIIGGPFEGSYRNPSVVHDFYCSTRIRKSQDVHWVFYDAMQTEGVAARTAWLMYEAVKAFGPKWRDPVIDPKCLAVTKGYDFERCARNAATPELRLPDMDKKKLQAFVARVEGRANPSDLEKLRKAIDRRA